MNTGEKRAGKPETFVKRAVRAPRKAATLGLAVVSLAGLAEGLRETHLYDTQNKPELQEKVDEVKDRQSTMWGIVNDMLIDPDARAAAPYDAIAVKSARKQLKKTGNVDKAVPPVKETLMSENGVTVTTLNFSGNASRKAAVLALQQTIAETTKTPLTKEGLDRIFGEYIENLNVQRDDAISAEEKAIASGLEDISDGIEETFDDKPLLKGANEESYLRREIGLLPSEELRTAEYPDGVNIQDPPLYAYPNTRDEVLEGMGIDPPPFDTVPVEPDTVTA